MANRPIRFVQWVYGKRWVLLVDGDIPFEVNDSSYFHCGVHRDPFPCTARRAALYTVAPCGVHRRENPKILLVEYDGSIPSMSMLLRVSTSMPIRACECGLFFGGVKRGVGRTQSG